MSKTQMNYKKVKNTIHHCLDVLNNQYNEINGENEKYNPFNISKFQNYNPCLDLFFEMNVNNYDSITLNHKYYMMDMNTVIDFETHEKMKKQLHIKFAPLLDPIHYLIGKYDVSKEILTTLPKYDKKVYDKLQTVNNASYVDNFFNYLSSVLLNNHKCSNSIDYYGSFLGIQEKYNFNASDDIDYLIQSQHFTENKTDFYEIDSKENLFNNFGSHKNKQKINIDSENVCLEFEEIEVENIDGNDSVIEDLSCVYEIDPDNTSVNSCDSDVNYSEDEDEDDEDEDESSTEWESDSNESSVEEQVNILIKDFPVQIICLEKCHGTLDELFENQKFDLSSIASALFQIIMTLIIYQKAYQFTHNDLHTNNIMYIETEEEYICYKYKNKYYKVPTYGRIYKIIDFGRSIYKYQGNIFCSDSFSPSGDANTQYNTEPYYDESRPRIDPNYSFDLCRLGCSIYDFIMEINDEHNKEFKPDLLQETIIRWVRDDNGKNVLYMRNGSERYEDFKLYKMIARTVHQHKPEAQLEYEFFNQFETDEKIESCINIDEVPCYVK
jgi:hypothetical protein